MTEEELLALYTEYRHQQTEVKGYFTCCDIWEFNEVIKFLEKKGLIKEVKDGS